MSIALPKMTTCSMGGRDLMYVNNGFASSTLCRQSGCTLCQQRTAKHCGELLYALPCTLVPCQPSQLKKLRHIHFISLTRARPSVFTIC